MGRRGRAARHRGSQPGRCPAGGKHPTRDTGDGSAGKHRHRRHPVCLPARRRRGRTQCRERLGRRAHRKRAHLVGSRRQLRHQRHARSGKTHDRRPAGDDLAQPQRPRSALDLPAPVPQCVLRPGQHVLHRAAQQQLRFPQRSAGQGRRLGPYRPQEGQPGRPAGGLVLRTARQGPEDRHDRRALRPADAGRRRRQHHDRHRLPRQAAAGDRPHRLLRQLPPGRAVVPEDRRAGARR